MRRQRRVRRFRGTGVRHVSELLSIILDEIERERSAEPNDAVRPAVAPLPLLNEVGAGLAQSTFSFYEAPST